MSNVPLGPRPTLRALLGARSTRYVLNLQQLGYNRDQQIEYLRQRHPGVSVATARAAVDRAERAARDVIEITFPGDPNFRALAGDLAPPDTGCLRWRYFVLVEWQPAPSGDPLMVPYVLTNDTSLSRNEIEQRATESLMGAAEAARGRRRGSDEPPTGRPVAFHYQAVERAC